MSENLDLVRSIYADWERGDFETTDWADPNIEVVVVDGPEPGRWHGLGGMAEAVRRFLGEWADFTIEVVQARELGDGRVLMLVRHGGRGRTSSFSPRIHTATLFARHHDIARRNAGFV